MSKLRWIVWEHMEKEAEKASITGRNLFLKHRHAVFALQSNICIYIYIYIYRGIEIYVYIVMYTCFFFRSWLSDFLGATLSEYDVARFFI